MFRHLLGRLIGKFISLRRWFLIYHIVGATWDEWITASVLNAQAGILESNSLANSSQWISAIISAATLETGTKGLLRPGRYLGVILIVWHNEMFKNCWFYQFVCVQVGWSIIWNRIANSTNFALGYWDQLIAYIIYSSKTWIFWHPNHTMVVNNDHQSIYGNN